MIIPWRVDVPQDRKPFVNWLILIALVVVFGFQAASVAERRSRFWVKVNEYKDHSVQEVAAEFGVDEQQLARIEESVDRDIRSTNHPHSGMLSVSNKDELMKQAILREYFIWGGIMPFILGGWKIKGLLGHIWLHADIIHLFGNMLFLWIFGNAVCAKIGNRFYLPVYVGLGVIAGVAHLLFKGGNVLGASGAINGIVGMYLVFFPENGITCYIVFWFLLTPYVKEFCISSIWMILFWLAFDIFGAMMGDSGVAYFAHLGGFAGGVILAILLLKFKLIVMEERYERSLLQMFSGREGPAEYETTPLFLNRSGITERDLELTTSSKAEAVEHEPIPLDSPPISLEPEVPPPAATEAAEPKLAPLEPAPIPLEPEVPEQGFIRFTCSCGKRFKVPPEFAGKRGKCPKCQERIRIPEK